MSHFSTFQGYQPPVQRQSLKPNRISAETVINGDQNGNINNETDSRGDTSTSSRSVDSSASSSFTNGTSTSSKNTQLEVNGVERPKRERKNRPGQKFGAKKTSWVWTWFVQDQNDQNVAHCDFCGKDIRRVASDKGSPKKLNEHLKTHKLTRESINSSRSVPIDGNGNTYPAVNGMGYLNKAGYDSTDVNHGLRPTFNHNHNLQVAPQEMHSRRPLQPQYQHEFSISNYQNIRPSRTASVAPWQETPSKPLGLIATNGGYTTNTTSTNTSTNTTANNNNNLNESNDNSDKFANDNNDMNGEYNATKNNANKKIAKPKIGNYSSNANNKNNMNKVTKRQRQPSEDVEKSSYSTQKFHKNVMKFLTENKLPISVIKSKSFLQLISDLKPEAVGDILELTGLYTSLLELSRFDPK